MAQAMLFKRKFVDCETQTGNDSEFFLNLSNSKIVRLYYSKSYKDYVLCFKLGSNKKFILTKSMWKIFRNYLPEIDKTLTKNAMDN
jgi:hypothetical protein